MLDYIIELTHPGTRDPSYHFSSDSVPSKTNALAVKPCSRMLLSLLEGLSDTNKTRPPRLHTAANGHLSAILICRSFSKLIKFLVSVVHLC